MYVRCTAEARRRQLQPAEAIMATLIPAQSVQLLPAEQEAAPEGCAVAVVDEGTSAFLLIKGTLDPAKELEKLSSQQVSEAAEGSCCHPSCCCMPCLQPLLAHHLQ